MCIVLPVERVVAGGKSGYEFTSGMHVASSTFVCVSYMSTEAR
jgi:hypothetical protein